MDMAEAENLLPLLLEYQKKGTRVSVCVYSPRTYSAEGG